MIDLYGHLIIRVYQIQIIDLLVARKGAFFKKLRNLFFSAFSFKIRSIVYFKYKVQQEGEDYKKNADV